MKVTQLQNDSVSISSDRLKAKEWAATENLLMLSKLFLLYSVHPRQWLSENCMSIATTACLEHFGNGLFRHSSVTTILGDCHPGLKGFGSGPNSDSCVMFHPLLRFRG